MSVARALAGLLIGAAALCAASAAQAQPGPDVDAGGPNPRVISPVEWARQRQIQIKHNDPEPTPPPDPALTVIEPTAAGVRAFLHRTTGALVTDVALRRVVLDFDPEDELLAEIPRGGAAGDQRRWVLLLDHRSDDTWAVLAAWTGEGVDVEAQAVAHGLGQRACLMIRARSASLDELRWLQLRADGVLETLGAFAAAPRDALELRHDAEGIALTLHVRRDAPEGAAHTWRLLRRAEGFQVIPPER